MTKGLSNIVGFVLMLALLSAGALLASKSVNAQIREMNTHYALDKALSAAESVYDALQSLSVQSPGSSSFADVGNLVVKFDSNTSTAIIPVKAEADILPPGSKLFKNGVEVISGADSSAYENSTEIVLENSVVRVVLNKTNIINTSTLVTSMILKPNKTMHPNFKILVGGNLLSGYGNGSVELVTHGSGLPEAVAVAKIRDSSSPYNYSIIFSLPSKSDYLKIMVRDIRKN